MKTFISALLVLTCIIVGVVIYSVYLDKVVTDLDNSLNKSSEYAQSENWDGCKSEIEILLKTWKRNETILAMFNDHQDVDSLKLSVNRLKEDVLFEDKKHFFKTLAETRIILQRLKKNETLTLENVLGLAPRTICGHIML